MDGCARIAFDVRLWDVRVELGLLVMQRILLEG